ncbi:adenosylcobinamide-phosphate synthase CbiB [Faunimonas sp. B44]|uniref:adenosylcobinamide-phosphate synthase CbiB n=1 Tax=Faunimonas sp. B44 TaxID=3461493 RepID=UPI004043FFED
MEIETRLAVLAVALVLDRLFGEPAFLWSRIPHPIVVVGSAITRLDDSLNDPDRSFRARRLLGALSLCILGLSAIAVGAAVSLLFSAVPGGFVLEAVVAAMLLAQKSLLDHVGAVAAALRRDGLPGGRRAVALIVGRDVDVLDEPGVSRAAIESLSENFSDGLVAPAFWYALLGLPGLFLFKVASTADSMIGHLSQRHAAFGWASARLDDVMNWIPARMTAALVAAAARLSGGSGAAALHVAMRDAPRHRSPNAGWPEAAMAGALGLALGGPRRYGPSEVAGAWLNAAGRAAATPADIRSAIRLVEIAWWLLLAGAAVTAALLWL